jgi:hypothetical protein
MDQCRWTLVANWKNNCRLSLSTSFLDGSVKRPPPEKKQATIRSLLTAATILDGRSLSTSFLDGSVKRPPPEKKQATIRSLLTAATILAGRIWRRVSNRVSLRDKLRVIRPKLSKECQYSRSSDISIRCSENDNNDHSDSGGHERMPCVLSSGHWLKSCRIRVSLRRFCSFATCSWIDLLIRLGEMVVARFTTPRLPAEAACNVRN